MRYLGQHTWNASDPARFQDPILLFPRLMLGLIFFFGNQLR